LAYCSKPILRSQVSMSKFNPLGHCQPLFFTKPF
jgi:hypothetical protein